MPQFKIEMELASINERIILTDFDQSSNQTGGLTFNENLVQEENDRFVLTFQIAGESGRNKTIPLAKLIAIGRPIWLHLNNPNRVIRMVISSYSPVVGPENTIYNVECQDYASYAFARNNAGLTLDTISDEDFLDWLENIAESTQPKVSDIAQYILERGWLATREPNSPSGWVFQGWIPVVDENDKLINLEVSASNTYGALIELANLANMHLRFDYEEELVIFTDKESESLDKNYTLKRGVNLQNFGISYRGDNMSSIFYVDAAEDEFGLTTLINSETDYLDNFLFDFNYFKDRNLIDDTEYNEIVNEINNNLKVINGKLSNAINEKYTQIGVINNIWNRINNLAEILAAPTRYDGYVQDYVDLDSQFYRPIDGQFAAQPEEENLTVLNILWNDLPSSQTGGTLAYPIYFTYFGKQYTATSNAAVDLGQGVSVRIYFTSGAGRVGWPTPLSQWKVFIEGINGTNTSFDKRRFNVVSATVKYTYNRAKFKYYYPLFDALFLYDNENAINKKYNELLGIIEDFVELKAKDEAELQCIINYPSGDPSCAQFNIPTDDIERDAREVFLEDRIDSYVDVIGKQLSGGAKNVGKYSLIQELFLKYNNTYVPTPVLSIMDKYRAAFLEKQKFWYDLKEKRQHIFLEGYYENDVETDPAVLKAQAQLVYNEHNKPLEDFNLTYIDISDVVGVKLQDIEPGDFVTLREDQLAIQDSAVSKLKVASVSRNLRENANISLTIFRYNLINNLLEKIVARNQ